MQTGDDKKHENLEFLLCRQFLFIAADETEILEMIRCIEDVVIIKYD